jgi:superfamily II DNA or RNA helicase
MNNQEKGLNYEIFIKNYLEEDSQNQAWLWKDIPEFNLKDAGLLDDWNLYRYVRKENKINGLPDLGTDILLKSNNTYKLIQCKNYGPKNYVNISDLAGFYGMMVHFKKDGILYYTSKLSHNLKSFKPVNEVQFIRKEFILEKNNNTKSIKEPYDYQIDAYEKLKDSNRAILNFPCGMGKTLTSIMIAKNYDNIIIISPLIAYAKQNLERFQEEFDDKNYNFILVNSEGIRDSNEILKIIKNQKKNILSFTYKSVDVLLEIIDSLKNVFIIIDEFHNLSKNDIFNNESVMNKILISNKKILFMSATPKFFNLEESDYENEDIFGNNIYSISMAHGISKNQITDYEIYLPNLISKNYLDDISNEISIKDYSNELTLKGKFILRGMMETGAKKCIIYLRNQEDAKSMVNLLNKLNEYFFIDLYTDFIISDNNYEERKEILNKFSNYNGYSLICSVDILNECIDIPQCDSIFITYPSESKICNIQRMCRANRKDKNNIHKKSKIFLWSDEYNDISIFISHLKEFDEIFIENKVCILDVTENKGGILERNKEEFNNLYKELDNIIISIRKFGYGIDSWKKNLNELKEFIKTKKPNAKSKDETERKLGKWLELQVFSFKHNQNIMKVPEIKELWNEFTSENKNLFVSNNETWSINLNKLEKFILSNNRLPTQSSKEDKDTILLAKWIVRNNDEYNKNEKAMKDEETRSLWNNFKENYSKFFYEKNDLWNDNMTLIENFIKLKNVLPVENKSRKEEYDLRIWLKTQIKIYNKNQFENDNNKRLIIENFLSKYSHLLSIKSNFENWLENYEDFLDYIKANNSLPREKIKISTNIDELKKRELEDEKRLGVWKSNTIQNSKINFATVLEDIDISKLTDSEKEKHLQRLEKYNNDYEKNNLIISQDYSKLNKKDKIVYDKISEKIKNQNIIIEQERFETFEKLRLWNDIKTQFPKLF